RVRVDDDRPEAVLAQHLQRLRARVIELAGLADHDRTRTDQTDRAEITPPGHTPPLSPTHRAAARHRAAPGRPRDGTAPTGRAAMESRGLRRCRRRARRG